LSELSWPTRKVWRESFLLCFSSSSQVCCCVQLFEVVCVLDQFVSQCMFDVCFKSLVPMALSMRCRNINSVWHANRLALFLLPGRIGMCTGATKTNLVQMRPHHAVPRRPSADLAPGIVFSINRNSSFSVSNARCLVSSM